MKKNLRVDFFGEYSSLMDEVVDFQVRLKDCSYTTVLEEGVYPGHRHSQYEILLIDKNPYECKLDGAHLLLKEGDLILIQPGQIHEDYMKKNGSLYAFHFQLIPNGQVLKNIPIFSQDVSPQQQISHWKSRGLGALLELLTHENEPGETHSFRLNNALFEVIFRRILTFFPTSVLHQLFQQQIILDRDACKLTAIFQRHLYTLPSLEDLCRDMAMSRSSLHRLTQRLYGLSPCKAFIRFKMLRAKEYIQENSGISVKELSDIFGFSTQSHFSWAFHKELGSYPSEIIRMAQR